jgi:hypothetical protein
MPTLRFRCLPLLGLCSSLLFSLPAQAGLTTDLQNLAVNLDTIQNQLAWTQFTGGETCSQLGTLSASVEDYVRVAENIQAQLAAPLTLTTADLTSLDDLTNIAARLAQDSVRLSLELRSVEGIVDVFEYRAALSAMLRLSTDIGKMADRILEMADRILVVADDIGAMADRIVVTQQLQNANMAMIQQALLTTQQNMVAMSGSMSTIAYNVSLAQIKLDTQTLSASLDASSLTPSNMADKLAAVQLLVSALVLKTGAVADSATVSSKTMSQYINGDTLTLLGDLSVLNNGLSVSINTYASAINQLAPLTEAPVLRDATASMLTLTRDIGLMSNRIMQMSDKIIVMADNIGAMSGRIVETQTIQQSNSQMTLTNLQTAQNTTISMIKNMGL